MDTEKKIALIIDCDSDKALVHAIAPQHVLFEDSVCPLTESRAANGIDPITHRNYHIQIVIRNDSFNGSTTFQTNLCNFCTS